VELPGLKDELEDGPTSGRPAFASSNKDNTCSKRGGGHSGKSAWSFVSLLKDFLETAQIRNASLFDISKQSKLSTSCIPEGRHTTNSVADLPAQ
jgi:hypothetical protein